MPQPLLGMEVAELREALGPNHPEYRAKQVYHAIYSAKVSDLLQISTLPAPLRKDLAAGHTVGLPALARRYESTDGTRRYLLELEDHSTVEAVLMPEPGRDTICISTQVGCPVDCKFCMTALMGLERNLTAGEIVGQARAVAESAERDQGYTPAHRSRGRRSLAAPDYAFHFRNYSQDCRAGPECGPAQAGDFTQRLDRG